MLTLKQVSPFDSEVISMIARLDQYQAGLYPATSNHFDSAETLSDPLCRLVGAFADDKLLGIGAAKLMQGYGELKRFYLDEAFRGQGISERIIKNLEQWLLANDLKWSRLETGIHQPAAIRFYQKLGYVVRGPFGDYGSDDFSVFMEKELSTPGQA